MTRTRLTGLAADTLAAASLAGLASAASPGTALAHTGPPPSPATIWYTWTLNPEVVAGLALGTLVYAVGVARLWRRAGRGHGIAGWRVVLFSFGVLALVIALVSPLDALGSALFSGHMVQHLVLVLVAAPLLLLGSPQLAFVWALPGGTRHRAGAWWLRTRLPRRMWRRLSLPLVVGVLHAVALWAWHFPTLYEAALWYEGWHALEHASFFLTALLFWWVVLHSPPREDGGDGAVVLLIFATAMQSGILGALLTFSSTPWYLAHGASAGAWGFSLLEDQQLAGLIMWVPGSVIYVGAAMGVLWRWLDRSERADAARPADLSRVASGLGRSTGVSRTLGVLLVLAVAGGTMGCDLARGPSTQAALVGGEPGAGRVALQAYGCVSCHEIPGVRGGNGTVGPSLAQVGRRTYLAGRITNTPENMMAWIMFPRDHDPRTAMPDLGVPAVDARNMVTYLYTLR